MGKIRIIGGKYRRQELLVIEERDLRPTLDRVKETLFNWLGQDLTGCICLDLFAGSGSLGLEALSRNASHVVLVEKSVKIFQSLKSNLNKLKPANINFELINQEAIEYLKTTQKKFNLIFLDPPYQSNLLNEALSVVDRVLLPDGLLYLEYENPPNLNEWKLYKSAKAGNLKYSLIKRK